MISKQGIRYDIEQLSDERILLADMITWTESNN